MFSEGLHNLTATRRAVKRRHLLEDGPAPKLILMIYTPQPPASLVLDWIERHRDPMSFVLHLFGIPCTILGVLLVPIYLPLLSIPLFLVALGLFVGGFGLQFLGHALEGSEPGEITAIRRWWRRRAETRISAAPVEATYLDVEAN